MNDEADTTHVSPHALGGFVSPDVSSIRVDDDGPDVVALSAPDHFEQARAEDVGDFHYHGGGGTEDPTMPTRRGDRNVGAPAGKERRRYSPPESFPPAAAAVREPTGSPSTAVSPKAHADPQRSPGPSETTSGSRRQNQSRGSRENSHRGGGGGGGNNKRDGHARRGQGGGHDATAPQSREYEGGGGMAADPHVDAGEPIVTPELLVDALSGHEDGLLAIAERLMERYDKGYDVMGEAIIDAFADVQKLFQHVVEAAHMEGAAFESSRREGELREWKARVAAAGMDVNAIMYGTGVSDLGNDLNGSGMGPMEGTHDSNGIGGGGPGGGGPDGAGNPTHRHEELIDQDVRDVLLDAIHRGQPLRDADRHSDCRDLYESACSSASALLPVDSDHRGRLQLAAARAESMTADRSCAILRYSMDDVLRSGLTLTRGGYEQVDVEQRGDCVLDRVDPLLRSPSVQAGGGGVLTGGFDESSIRGGWANSSHGGNLINTSSSVMDVSTSNIEQSAEEALASLVEEMKEMLSAPVYAQSPIRGVSERFWMALGEATRSNSRKEERLEQVLAKIKGDFLLTREEWEENLSQERSNAELYKRKFHDLKLKTDRHETSQYPHRTRGESVPHSMDGGGGLHGEGGFAHRGGGDWSSGGGSSRESGGANTSSNAHSYAVNENFDSGYGPSRYKKTGGGSSSQSVASFSNEFAQRAKSLVGAMSCANLGGGDRGGGHRPNQHGPSGMG